MHGSFQTYTQQSGTPSLCSAQERPTCQIVVLNRCARQLSREFLSPDVHPLKHLKTKHTESSSGGQIHLVMISTIRPPALVSAPSPWVHPLELCAQKTVLGATAYLYSAKYPRACDRASLQIWPRSSALSTQIT